MTMEDLLLAIGRLLLGGYFVFAGARHFFILPAVTAMFQHRGVPWPRTMVVAGSVFELAAGLLLILGVYPVAAAFGLIAFTLVASVIALNFWDMDGPDKLNAQNMWLANLAVVGGLLTVAAEAL